ncbi:MAG: hypothetical protein HYV63_33000 [Candidatus Schekmanbacteria bacterium]|nr:hypothetical protein [Candidatus Schekmanbacteria bacterium]
MRAHRCRKAFFTAVALGLPGLLLGVFISVTSNSSQASHAAALLAPHAEVVTAAASVTSTGAPIGSSQDGARLVSSVAAFIPGQPGPQLASVVQSGMAPGKSGRPTEGAEAPSPSAANVAEAARGDTNPAPQNTEVVIPTMATIRSSQLRAELDETVTLSVDLTGEPSSLALIEQAELILRSLNPGVGSVVAIPLGRLSDTQYQAVGTAQDWGLEATSYEAVVVDFTWAVGARYAVIGKSVVASSPLLELDAAAAEISITSVTLSTERVIFPAPVVLTAHVHAAETEVAQMRVFLESPQGKAAMSYGPCSHDSCVASLALHGENAEELGGRWTVRTVTVVDKLGNVAMADSPATFVVDASGLSWPELRGVRVEPRVARPGDVVTFYVDADPAVDSQGFGNEETRTIGRLYVELGALGKESVQMAGVEHGWIGRLRIPDDLSPGVAKIESLEVFDLEGRRLRATRAQANTAFAQADFEVAS